MAEVKNAFIKSKMNKDLDARLLPNGEYREGVNIQVSRSEGADVGALENVLGNTQLVDFKIVSQCDCPLKTIGTFTDGVSNDIYVFLTDFEDTNFKTATIYNKDSNNYIYVYNVLSQESLILVTGSFLNFSTTNPILSVNFLEGILFWTDNRNQPRKLNINRAIAGATGQTSNNYYTTEDQISVASYNPYQPIDLYFKKWGSVKLSDTAVTNGTSVTIEKSTLSGLPTFGAIVEGAGISAPYPTITAYNESTGVITLSSTQTIAANTLLSFYVTSSFGSNGTYFSSMFDATNRYAPDGVTLNPTFQTSNGTVGDYPGDPDFLEDKFVRFSYRFKFDDGENSIFAPFTQPAFIPKQDGYFLGATTPAGNTKDENATYRTTIVSFMENQVNNILIQIPLPCSINNLYNEYKIIEIDILYKESDAIAVQVVDTIQVASLASSTDKVIVYNYQGVKPYKTLPEKDLVRVYDKVPVKALGQEIISNRIVYSNFQTQHTPPEALNYNVGVTQKNTFNINAETDSGDPQPAIYYTSSVEYPQHTVKQNRNYQVGVLLSDRYGRTSTVLLSSAVSQGVLDGISYGGSTVYVPYDKFPGAGNNSTHSFTGDSIKVLFNQAIGTTGLYAGDPDLLTGWPGLYNGTKTSSKYNPLGWYSYKIVVKQQEQEYYNVYLPGIVNGYPGDVVGPFPDPVNTTAFITLMNDNINKVPRDLSEVGPLQSQFRSSEDMFGRVTPQQTALDTKPLFNNPYYPTIEPNVVNTIGPENTLLDSTVVFDEIYQTASNPLVGRVSQTIQTLSTAIGNGAIGSGPVDSGDTYNILLGIYETAPTESRLEIFWETSSAGLISDLNLAIEQGTSATTGSPGAKGFSSIALPTSTTWVYDQNESMQSGTTIAASFYPYTQVDLSLGITPINSSTITNFWVTDGNQSTRTSDFTLSTAIVNGINTYNLKTARNFYFGDNASTLENYTFSFAVYDLVNNLSSTVTAVGALTNVAPSITNCVASFDPASGATVLYTYAATNGSADVSGIPPANTKDLTFSLTSQSPALPAVFIDPDTGILTEPTGSLNGPLTVTIQVKDASGEQGSLTDSCTTVFNGSQGILTVATNTEWYSGNNLQINSGPESSGFYWSTDKTNEVSSNPIPGLSTSFRAPINSQPTPTNQIGIFGVNSASLAAQGVCGNGAGLNNQWQWKNTNRNALVYNAANLNPTGLTNGTGYIMLDFENKVTENGDPQNDKPSVIWPTYLQYRNPNGVNYPNNWENAIDIEGEVIKFGGTQTNNYSISLNSARPDFTETGVVDQPTTTISNTDSFYVNTDAMQSQSTGRTPTESSNLFSKGSRIFAFGKDQGYNTRPDYFGDYRLIVRYPFGDNVPNSLTSFGNKIIPVLTPQSCPGQQGGSSSESPYAQYNSSLTTQLVTLSYGDLYNPTLDSTNPPSYFSYRISTQGSTVKENAKSFVPAQVVYAREWSFRYVTQFYSNPELTILYSNTTANSFYSYSSSTDGTSLNAKYGNEMSNTTNTSITGTDRAPIGTATNQDRRWIAQFDGVGKKIATTAEPVTYDQENNAPALVPPAGTPPTYSDGLLNSTGVAPFPQIVNNESGNSVTLIWLGGSSQTVFASSFVSNLTNNLGGVNPAPFAAPAVFLKFYSPDQNTGYAEVSSVNLNINGNASNVSYVVQNTSGTVIVSITNAQNVITGGGNNNNLPSSNYYYAYN